MRYFRNFYHELLRDIILYRSQPNALSVEKILKVEGKTIITKPAFYNLFNNIECHNPRIPTLTILSKRMNMLTGKSYDDIGFRVRKMRGDINYIYRHYDISIHQIMECSGLSNYTIKRFIEIPDVTITIRNADGLDKALQMFHSKKG